MNATLAGWADREPELNDGGDYVVTVGRTVTVDGFAYSTTAPARRISTACQHYAALAFDGAALAAGALVGAYGAIR